MRGVLNAFMGRFTDALRYQKANFSSKTYLLFTRIGYTMSLIPIVALVLMQPTAPDLLLCLYGFLVSFLFFFSIFYLAVIFWNREMLAGLSIFLLGLAMYIWFSVLVAPESEGNLDEMLLIGVYIGWPLSWSILGAYIYRERLEQERGLQVALARNDEVSAAISSVVKAGKAAEKEPARARAFASASLLTLTSAGIMLWMVLDIAFHPSEYDMETAYDYLGIFLFALPQVAAIVALWYAWKHQGVKTFMIAAMLSAFSFAGPLALMAEAILWISFKRHDLEWEHKKPTDEFLRSLTGVSGGLLVGAAGSFMVVGILLLLSALSGTQGESAEDEAFSATVSIVLAAGLIAVVLLMSRSSRGNAA